MADQIIGDHAASYQTEPPLNRLPALAAPNLIKGRFIIKFKDTLKEPADVVFTHGVPFHQASASRGGELDALNARHRVKSIKPLFHSLIDSAAPGEPGKGVLEKRRQNVRSAFAKIKAKYPKRTGRARPDAITPDLTHIYLVDVPESADIPEICAQYAANPNVEYAVPDYIATAQLTPNDPYYLSSGSWGQPYDDLWGLKKIHADLAWDRGNGQGVVVAVVDTGIDYNHPDLAGNVWTNPLERSGLPGVDDDHNGFVDDLRGWDFAYGDNNPADGNGHGTHVAGTIAAVGNNALGVIGVAYGSRVMGVKGLDNNGSGQFSALSNAIVYAAQNGADVINNSWGCYGCADVQQMKDAVQFAHSLGAVVVFAAGNNSADVKYSFPANIQDVVTVASTGSDDSRSYFSNVGYLIDLAAPGGGPGTEPVTAAPYNILSLRAQGTGNAAYAVGNEYIRLAGTSMAAPHVAGVAAVVLSINPDLTRDQVISILRHTAEDQIGGTLDTPGYDPYFGWGRLNAAAAAASAFTPPADPPILKVLPESLEFRLPQGACSATSSHTLELFNLGGGALDWTSAAPSWITADPPSGRAYTSVDVSVDVTQNKQGIFRIDSAFGLPATAQIPVSVNIVPHVTVSDCSVVVSQATGAQDWDPLNHFEIRPPAISDGSGGAIYVWVDTRYGNPDLFVQHFDSTGTPLWTPDGMRLTTATGAEYLPTLVSDGAGGAIITWAEGAHSMDTSDKHIKAQRVTSDGRLLWGTDGVWICQTPGGQVDPVVAPDASGGAVIAWTDYRYSPTAGDIFAQRISAEGVPLWTMNGVPVTRAADAQFGVKIAGDNTGGAFLVWHDRRSQVRYDVYAQRLNAAGTAVWTRDGMPLGVQKISTAGPNILPDGSGGAIIAWHDFRNVVLNPSGGTVLDWSDIYAVRLTADGQHLWDPTGVPIVTGLTANPKKFFPGWGPEDVNMISDEQGGIIFAWHDMRSHENWDIYAQRLSGAGNPVWTLNGVPVVTAPESQISPALLPDGFGGAIIAWTDFRFGNFDIYAQRIDAAGAPSWGADGVQMQSARMDLYPYMVSLSGNRFLLTWDDHRNCVSASGTCTGTGIDLLGLIAEYTVDPAGRYTVTPVAETHGSISPSVPQNVNAGQTVSFTIMPDNGYRIGSVTGCNGVLVGSTYTTGPILADCSVIATFVITNYIITAAAGPNGTISPSGEVAVLSGTNKSFTITPASGYKTASVVVDGVDNGVFGTYTFTNVTANHTISASFSPTITASAGANGTISPTGISIVPSGTDKTYTITPSVGYHMADVLVDGASVGALSSYTFTNVTTPHTISATFAANPTMIITATAGANGSINPSGEVAVLSGTNKSFTITPASGYKTASVVVDGVDNGVFGTYTFTNVTANHTISAVFSPTITASAGANGTISPTGISIVPSGTDKTYTITPSVGYHVADVLVDGVSAGAVATYTFTSVTTPHTISATFAANPTMIITATAGANGSINPSGEVAVLSGTNKSFTITANSGYKTASVVVDGVDNGVFGTYTFTNVTANHTISAVFSPTITASAGANGTLSPTGISIVPSGTDKTYTITPSVGYHVADVLVDGVSVGAVATYTFTNVTTPHTISATFAANPTMIITATAGANGSINPSGEVAVLSGTNKSFTITPASGYKTAAVVVDGVDNGVFGTYTFTNVTANHTISAVFSPTITASAGANGTLSPTGISIVPSGTDKTYTITPSVGYHVADVLVDGASVGAVTSYTFTAVTTPHTISAAFAANPAYTITSSTGPGGSITPSGATSLLGGVNQRYTMTPATGYRVADVLVDGLSVGAVTSYTFSSVSADHTISVTFNPTIVASTGAHGTVTPAGTSIVPSGTDKTYTITPSVGYHVADVLVDGVSAGAVTSYTFTNVTTPHTISVTFAANPAYIITSSAGPGGSITPSGATSLLGGVNQRYTMTPATGYRVADVLVDGLSVGAVTSYTFSSVSADHTISVTFNPTIVASTGANGTVTPAGTSIVPSGTDKTYTIRPNAGYHVADVLADGASVGAVTSYTFTAVTTPHTISVTFAANPAVIISAGAGPNGTISPSGEVSVLSETNKSFTITPASGYRVAAVVVDGTSVGAMTSYQFVNVTANHTISATFSPTITSTSGANGTISPRGTAVVASGSDATYTITPYTGYHIADVVVDGVSAGAVNSYAFTNVTTPHTISVTFTAN